MRADARRNRERLLDAAVEVVLEVGTDAPLDAVARRAQVGIGTLYRHFPDRTRLWEAVAHHTLGHSITAAETALASAGDGDAALRRYAHAAVERGVGVLNLVHPLLDAPDWSDERRRMTALLEAILERGKQAGHLRPDVQIPDIVLPIIRFSRPLGLGLSRADEQALAHRHLDIYLDGLRTADPTARPWPEPAVIGRWTG